MRVEGGTTTCPSPYIRGSPARFFFHPVEIPLSPFVVVHIAARREHPARSEHISARRSVCRRSSARYGGRPYSALAVLFNALINDTNAQRVGSHVMFVLCPQPHNALTAVVCLSVRLSVCLSGA